MYPGVRVAEEAFWVADCPDSAFSDEERIAHATFISYMDPAMAERLINTIRFLLGKLDEAGAPVELREPLPSNPTVLATGDNQ